MVSVCVRVALQFTAVPSPVLSLMMLMSGALYLYVHVSGNHAVRRHTMPFLNFAANRSRAFFLHNRVTSPPSAQLPMKETRSNYNAEIARSDLKGEATYPVTNTHASSRLRLVQ
eukprot:scpid103618/ scgid6175/ 